MSKRTLGPAGHNLPSFWEPCEDDRLELRWSRANDLGVGIKDIIIGTMEKVVHEVRNIREGLEVESKGFELCSLLQSAQSPQ